MPSLHIKFIIFILFVTGIFACTPKVKIASVEKSNILLHDSLITDDPTFTNLIKPYKEAIDDDMNTVLIISEMPFVKGQPEGLLGNLVADLILKKTHDYYYPEDNQKVDLCLLNNGGLRTALPEGEITRGKIFELMPFENEMVVLTLSGDKMQGLFNYVAASEGMPLAGVKMGIKDKEAVNIFIAGVPFDNSKQYKVVTSDYLAHGGDKMYFFKDPIKTELIGHKLRDAIIQYMLEENKKGNKLSSKKDGRVYHEQ